MSAKAPAYAPNVRSVWPQKDSFAAAERPRYSLPWEFNWSLKRQPASAMLGDNPFTVEQV